MKYRVQTYTIAVTMTMILLILDFKTVAQGAAEGLALCMKTIIPSLFPFIFLSTCLNKSLVGRPAAFLRPLGRLCGIPVGCEYILLLGLLGGYPTGAQMIAQAYQYNALDKPTAQRLLCFCNNAGPSFIFGIIAGVFSSWKVALYLWLLQIISALLTGIILKGDTHLCSAPAVPSAAPDNSLKSSINAMCIICGWAVLFHVVITVLRHWFLWLLPDTAQIVIAGFLELTNGCCDLGRIPSEGLRFVICCCVLTFGGICVMLQVHGLTGPLGIKEYFQGKFLQTTLAFILSVIVQQFIFRERIRLFWPLLSAAVVIFGVLILFIRRKSSSIVEKIAV